jgi:hypothetical protein
MALLDRVSEGQLNERLMNVAGSDEPITRTVFGQFFEQESQRYLTFTMIRTPSSYGRARGVSFNMMMRMETRSTTGSS